MQTHFFLKNLIPYVTLVCHVEFMPQFLRWKLHILISDSTLPSESIVLIVAIYNIYKQGGSLRSPPAAPESAAPITCLHATLLLVHTFYIDYCYYNANRAAGL